MDRFVWKPGNGFDAEALKRMRKHFPRPSEPMGEAWFMSDKRVMYDELLGDIDKLSAKELQKPLEEIASGMNAFGPMREWISWYHYLLAQLIPRSHENHLESLLEYLVTGFVAHYPNGVIYEPYRGFRDDALLTIGQCIMEPQCWSTDGKEIIVGRILHRSNNNPNRVWMWWDASGDFAASMFFCLKYLPTDSIAGWLKSCLAIPSAHWRAQVIVWLVGAHKILHGIVAWPSEFKVHDRPGISWAWSHVLNPNVGSDRMAGLTAPIQTFVPDDNRIEVIRVLQEELSEDRYLEWLDSMAAFPYLDAELAEIPTNFERLYLQSKDAVPTTGRIWLPGEGG
jgi:hypothetical protein